MDDLRAPVPAWPPGNSEMARHVRAHDWARTPLGPIEGWPQSLRTAVDMVLAMPGPATILWGPAHVQLYNDAYVAIARDRHPALLGRRAAEGWPDVYGKVIAPLLDAARAGRATQLTGFPVALRAAGGGWEERVFDTAWSPIRDERGTVAGALQTLADVTDRHRAEAAQRESEARFRSFVTASSDVIYRMGPDWGEMRALDGRGLIADTPDPSRSWLERYIHPDDQPRVLAAIEAAIRAKRAFELEHRVRRVDGSLGWTLSRAVPLLDGAGEIVEWLGTASDVTARKEAEARLRESEARFRQFADASCDLLWVRDAETLRWEYLSPAFEAIYGLPCAEALAGDTMRNWTELIHPEDREHAVASIARVRDGARVTFEYRVRRPSDGRVRWLRNTDFPMRDGTGRIVRVGGIGQDVTELKRVEEALRDSEGRLRTLMEGIPQLVWRSAAAGRWTWASPQWLAYTGQSEAETRGLGWLEAVHPDDRDTAMAAWREADARGEVQAGVRLFHAGEKRYRWFQTRGVPVRDDGGAVAEWLGTMTDIEDQVRSRDELERRVEERTAELMAAEASLRQAQKMDAVGQLTGGIAHDFNNMLQGIGASLELVRRRTEQGRRAEAERYAERAQETVRRAAALTHRLLAFARQQALDPAPVNLDELVGGMAELIQRTVGSQVQVEVRLGDGAWPVLCDRSQLENALLNLCVNARDAMSEGGWLTISTEETQLSAADLAGEEGEVQGAYAVLAVADTGTGMDEATQARVFEPFYTTKPLGQGTGLGLSQVYGFVRQSGGLVRLDSVPGQGTTVRLYLPRHEAAAAVGDDATTADVVLLVEDEENLRAMAAEWLREAGLRVLEAADGAAALRLLHGGGRVDLLVTDVGLPGGTNGRQVAEAARAQRPALPVLLVTGYAGEALRGTALPPGVAVLDKPFALGELAARVRAMLAAGA